MKVTISACVNPTPTAHCFGFHRTIELPFLPNVGDRIWFQRDGSGAGFRVQARDIEGPDKFTISLEPRLDMKPAETYRLLTTPEYEPATGTVPK